MDKKKIGAGFAGALQKAADATKAAKLAVQDMAADAKQSREKKKADAQKAASAKELIAAAESEKGTAPEVKSIATRNALHRKIHCGPQGIRLLYKQIIQGGYNDAGS